MQLIPPKGPNLPQSPGQYATDFQERYSSVLRQYFNKLDVTFQQLLLGHNHYGCFHQTANVTAAVANTAYPVAFNLTHHAYGISIEGTPATDITVTAPGIYMLEFAAELDSTGGSGLHAHFWVRINGVDETYSANKVVVDSGNRAKVAAWSYQLELAAGDVVNLMWAVSDTRVFLLAEAAAAPIPAISAVSLSMFWLFAGGVT